MIGLFRRKRVAHSRPTLGKVLQRMNLSLALIAVGTAGIFLTLVALLALRAYANHNLHLIARSISYTVEAAVVFDDRSAAREALMLIASNEEVSEAKILNKDGRLLAYWHHPKDGPLHGLEQLVARWAMPEAIELPINHEGKLVGKVWLSSHGGSLLRFLLRGLAGIIACLALSTLCALILSRRMLHGIVRSLNDIANVAHVVRSDRSFGQRVPSAPIAELHELSNDFNGLLEELETWQAHLKQENDSLTHRATHDSLTGLPNRAFFEGQLSHALSHITPEEKLAVLFIDGDRFKEVNDSHGHAAGDAVLTTIAGRIRSQLRDGDVVARMGGDEFAVLLSPVRRQADVTRIADKIIDSMTQPVALPNQQQVIASLSIGIAFYPDHAATSQGLLHEADDAMYQAKHRYHGGWRLAIQK
ncbi:diguanylate cyclase domain-containing protein [Serratia rhizosphaerae]|uniref:Diguanylate cyclase n=1 Tax=Serratia rhizosphaerae TaxID=2597702 RepID=A0ABX6GKB6_9GAMM|nr:diguanylate cyclase [Serratia rhizosphaerae]MEB6334850.1 diguanylate cyclase [Serratia rhizosphaerae]QHA86695.1 diguanylate cyclase [Serratia rhizosphaerae]